MQLDRQAEGAPILAQQAAPLVSTRPGVTWRTCCAVLPCPACTKQVGGSVGDWAAARSPKHGRVFAAQFSVGIGVPIAALIFKVRRGLGLLAGWSMGLEGGGEMASHSHGRMLWDGRMDATPRANVL